MCGFTGLFDLKGDRTFDRRTLEAMTKSIAHRGPDGDGFYIDRGIAFGHRRLAIIALASGHQPMHARDGNISVVFNGEIYNYRTLQAQLVAMGHVFQTDSDTEVLIHGWRAWGEKLVEHLRGQFAFAIWDKPNATLMLARDRLGEKPLHYAVMSDGTLAFASEIKALLTIDGLSRDLDPYAVEDFFALGYVPDPKTIFKAIRKLPPGATMVARRGREPVIARYWDVRNGPTAGAGDRVEELRERLAETVGAQMIADVDLGAFLSGGVDSSAVVALMSKHTPDPVRTFSISFAEAAFDESVYAQTVAEQYHTRHQTDRVSANDVSLTDQLPAIFDEPFGDSSAIPTYIVCRHARRHVKVCLSGDGGDEALAGYRRYRFFMGQQGVRRMLPERLRAAAFGAAARYYPKLDRAPTWLRAKTTFAELAVDDAEAFYRMNCAIPDEMRALLYTGDFQQSLRDYRGAEVIRGAFEASTGETPLQQAQYADLTTYLPGDILVKVDRTSMANSLEVRPPLLDPDFVAWCYSLPADAKLRRGQGKAILRDAVAPLLPPALLSRPKMGFSIPIADWFRGELRRTMEEMVADPVLKTSGYLDTRMVETLWREHLSGVRNHARPLWLLLMFAGFLRHTMTQSEPVARRVANARR